MNYPSLSLEKKQIGDAFGIHQHPSPGRTNIVLKSISSKFLPNQTNQCEQCEYKTSKYNSMYSHMRVKHTDLRIKCTECNFSNKFILGKKGQITEVTFVGRGLVVNFTQRIVQNWNLMRRFLVTNATIQLPEVITLSFTLKVYMMELFTSANIAHHILHTKERGH